jgi:predicted CXXCH cytochrome family protein
MKKISVCCLAAATTRSALGLVLAVGTVLGAWFAYREIQPQPPVKRQAALIDAAILTEADLKWQSQPEFVGSRACQKCHADQFESYFETAHSRALQEVVAADEPPDATFDDPAAGRRYHTEHADGQLFHETRMLLPDGTSCLQSRFPVRYRMGSGHFGRGYLVAADGFLLESPISWYNRTERWEVSPGFEDGRRNPFGRTVPEGCLFCHSGHVERSTVSSVRMRIVEPAIGCERCHGPGKEHVERELAGLRDDGVAHRAIVSPGRLPRRRVEAICHQCHLEGDIRVAARGAHPDRFLPGELVENYHHDYLLRTPRQAMQVVGHVGQLARSACYMHSETLTCVTCHDPHASVAPEDRTAHYRSVCLSCHTDSACRLTPSERQEQRQNDCAACHMPLLDTNIPHTAFTHHQIGRHPLKQKIDVTEGAERLVPLFDLDALSDGDRQRSLGLALREILTHAKAGGLSGPEREEIAARAEKMLIELPEEFVDSAVESSLAVLFRLQSRDGDAEVAARRTLEFEDLDTAPKIAALTVIAGICLDHNRLPEAARNFAELTRLWRNSEDWTCLGACLASLDDTDNAIRTLEKSRTIDPESLATCELLAGLYRSRGDTVAEERMRTEIDRLKRRGTGAQ